MLISHESPVSILDRSRVYNDYDYALVHLFETNPEYYAFFKTSLAHGREVLLDNSIFELKEAFDSEKYAHYVAELRPTYFIVPDVLEDSQSTIASYEKFKTDYPDLPGLWIGAVQGETYQDIVECYRYMSENADYIAISFDFSWYQQIGYTKTLDTKLAKLERMCYGRQKLINMLINDSIWNHDKPHHLLGNSLAREMKCYKYIPSIRSVDTSNPVVAGIMGHRYITGYGLNHKPSTLLADLIKHEITKEQEANILYNVSEYKKICLC